MIDGDLLSKIFQKVAQEKLQAEIHAWIIHTGPPEVVKIYREYLDAIKENK